MLNFPAKLLLAVFVAGLSLACVPATMTGGDPQPTDSGSDSLPDSGMSEDAGADTGSDAGAVDAGSFSLRLAGPATITRTACSDAFTITGTSSEPVSLSSSESSLQFFSDVACSNAVTIVTPGGPAFTASVYVRGSTRGPVTLSAVGASQRATLNVLVMQAINISESFSQTVPASTGDDVFTRDDTATFNEAIRVASTSSEKDFAVGPGGAAQAIVYVPAGVYRALNIQMRDNVRLEINAGAMLMEFTGNTAAVRNLLVLDSPGLKGGMVAANATTLSNVTVIGTGTSDLMGTRAKPVPQPGWNVSHSFTLMVDPSASSGSSQLNPIIVQWADGVLLQNILSIGRNSDLTGDTGENLQNPAVKIKANVLSNSAHTYGPSHVAITNYYHLHAAVGGGPMQISNGAYLAFSDIYGEGGITVRLETDSVGSRTLQSHGCATISHGGGSLPGQTCTCTTASPCTLIYQSAVTHLTARNIACQNGQAAISLVPHNQPGNDDIQFTDVQSDNCAQGIFGGNEDRDDRLAAQGSFRNVSISHLTVQGSNVMGSMEQAQLPTQTSINSWELGPANSSVCLASAVAVQVTLSNCSEDAGNFTHRGNCTGGSQMMCQAGTTKNF